MMEKFAEKFFLTELCSNPINLHYTLSDPAAWGIDEKKDPYPPFRVHKA